MRRSLINKTLNVLLRYSPRSNGDCLANTRYHQSIYSGIENRVVEGKAEYKGGISEEDEEFEFELELEYRTVFASCHETHQ